ncbi:hypothetical protein TNCV_2514491 [Trichonephila clavipes]|nr:hypothetical protein TNCV_2514491 [Trichonephila clavipes]
MKCDDGFELHLKRGLVAKFPGRIADLSGEQLREMTISKKSKVNFVNISSTLILQDYSPNFIVRGCISEMSDKARAVFNLPGTLGTSNFTPSPPPYYFQSSLS